jgi:flagellar basal-body rod protein FlgB
MFPIYFDKALEIMEYGLDLRVWRQNILASNIANKDTPGYKSRDLGFRSVLEAAENRSGELLRTTDEGHMRSLPLAPEPSISLKDSGGRLDGNTVDMAEEMNHLVENALTYDALLKCVGKKFQLLKLSVQGG